MFNVVAVGDSLLIANFAAMPATVHASVVRKTYALSLQLKGKVQVEKLTGQVLNVRTGNLRASIDYTVTDLGYAVFGSVFSDGSVKYAGIHEFGGTIRHPGGTAYLPLGGSGKVAFVSNLWAASYSGDLPRTKPHDIPMPERSFLRSSLREMEPAISTGYKKAGVEGLRAARVGAVS